MRIITFCAVVIAVSTFTMAVEYVYGWSKVGPHAEAAWGYAEQLVTETIGGEARAEGSGAADSTLAGD